MICGVVDVGSNTMRLSIYRCENGTYQLLMNRKVMAGLASYVEHNVLTPEGVEVAVEVISSYRELLNNLEIGPMYGFATASLRNIYNTQEVVQQFLDETGIAVDVISGTEEAELSFNGALQDITGDQGLLVDLGGGSTELLQFADGKILSACSLPVGALNLFNRYVELLHPTKSERHDICNEVLKQLDRENVQISPTRHIYGVGGTARAACKIANHYFDRSQDCHTLTAKELKQLVKWLKEKEPETLRTILKLAPDRIHTILPGILLLDTIWRSYGAEDLTVSMCGVREGYLRKYVLQQEELA